MLVHQNSAYKVLCTCVALDEIYARQAQRAIATPVGCRPLRRFGPRPAGSPRAHAGSAPGAGACTASPRGTRKGALPRFPGGKTDVRAETTTPRVAWPPIT